ncbi:MAG TPA: class E sortase [Nocardioidaceae bacterium]|nr:class E sortase [Nocardioidaceae bacterium]
MSQGTGAPPTDETVDERPPRHAGRQRRRRGLSFWLGLVLVLGGLGMLGYVAWQMYGTNIVSRQTQERLVEDLEKEWSVAPGTTVEGEPAEPAEPADVPLGDASALVRIPAFGDDYVVPVLEGIGDEELSSGYGHFPDSADPGERGNYALAAHRVTHGEPLRDMPELRPGDEVVIETRKAIYTYVLDTNPNDLIVTFEDIWVVDPLPTNPDGGVQPAQRPGQRLITLTTCSELFHTDNRMIAFGHLVDTEKKQAAAAG